MRLFFTGFHRLMLAKKKRKESMNRVSRAVLMSAKVLSERGREKEKCVSEERDKSKNH